jgi:ketosteroid isomerase-like protein
MSAAERPDSAGVAGDPRDAVRAWWRAMRHGEIETLERLALEDYLSCGGPDGRTTGRNALLEGAAAFFAEAVVDRCAVEDFELRELGGTAVCSYRWSEHGRHRGEPFALAGVATDVLVQRNKRWCIQAHHVSMTGA